MFSAEIPREGKESKHTELDEGTKEKQERWKVRPSYMEPEPPRAEPSITKPQRSSFLPT